MTFENETKICDIMGQNQSHVAKHEKAERNLHFYLKMSKYITFCPYQTKLFL